MTDSTPLYLDPTQPRVERVRDLISRLNLAEKIGLMTNNAQGVPHLGLPGYNYWSEALHGVARNGRATVFPQAIGMGATWDPDLIHRVASAIGDEGRAKYHATLRRKGYTDIYQGLTFWSPNVNIFRDPRWGRGQETWGEDPYLTSEMGAAFVRGLQGDDPNYMKAAACAKHYAVHSGPEKLRHVFNVNPSKRDLYATYLPAFKKLVVEAKVEAVMGAYNAVYGVPCNASSFLLEEVLRQDWGFEGHVVSDCAALSDIHLHHHYTADVVESAAVALKAGCDLSCICTYDHLGEAIERGLINETDIDLALERTFGTLFKLGLFDPAENVPYAATPMSVVGCEAHQQLAYEAAVKSVVLLKNNQNILPLGDKVQSITVLGPNAGTVDVLLGNYYGINDHLTTLLEGIAGIVPEGVRLQFRHGVMLTEAGSNLPNWSLQEAASTDVTIACMGISPLLEGEEGESLLTPEAGDKTQLELPKVQIEYLKQLSIVGAKVVLVLFSGSPIALGEVADWVEAVVQVWYPGQEGGRAVADVLFGKAAPSGKLPITFPKATSQLPPFEDYTMTERTYRYATWEPQFPFGFGLSYTQFAYSGLKLAQNVLSSGESLSFSVTVSNTGANAGEEVVQVYLSDLAASTVVPFQSLAAFRRVALQPGQSQTLEFTLAPSALMLVDDEGQSKLEPGAFRLTIGGCAPGPRGVALGAPQPVSVEFKVQ
jgi:beta-glucosidase